MPADRSPPSSSWLVADLEAVRTHPPDEIGLVLQRKGGVVHGRCVQVGLAEGEPQLGQVGDLINLPAGRLEEDAVPTRRWMSRSTPWCRRPGPGRGIGPRRCRCRWRQPAGTRRAARAQRYGIWTSRGAEPRVISGSRRACVIRPGRPRKSTGPAWPACRASVGTAAAPAISAGTPKAWPDGTDSRTQSGLKKLPGLLLRRRGVHGRPFRRELRPPLEAPVGKALATFLRLLIPCPRTAAAGRPR